MRRNAVLLLVVVAACGNKPDRAKAQAACEHAVELGFWESSAGAASDPEAKQLLEDQKKGPVWKDAIDKCTMDAMDDASPAQVDCIMAAKSAADIDKCK